MRGLLVLNRRSAISCRRLYFVLLSYVKPTQDLKAGIGTWQCQCFHIYQFNELLQSINDCSMRPHQLASTHPSLREVSI